MTDSTNNLPSARLAKPSSDLVESATQLPCELQPATVGQGRSELGACLTLVSPSGMSPDDRLEWIAMAMKSLSGIPSDLLARGAQAARLSCRFPSEVVPTIMAEVRSSWEYRVRKFEDHARQTANSHLPRLEQKPPEYISPAEAKAILREFGLKSLSGRAA